MFFDMADLCSDSNHIYYENRMPTEITFILRKIGPIPPVLVGLAADHNTSSPADNYVHKIFKRGYALMNFCYEAI